jgi:hypothetical protein
MEGKSFDLDGTVRELVVSDDLSRKKQLAERIRDVARGEGVYPCSVNEFYVARGRGRFDGFTVPAINLRSMTYDLARSIFRVAKRNNSGAFIFEIARSEIGYTGQSPVEYSGVVLAAALKESYSGPVFVQGDHFQVNAAKFKENPDKEMESLKALITDAIGSGFYNIDIDSSTLVDLSQRDVKRQQLPNCEVCARLTQFIRGIEPEGVTVSVGERLVRLGIRTRRLRICTGLWPA